MGDGVLVYFGYPQAHEDDAERAVRAGLELVAAVSGLKTHAALKTRVGIATGLVVVGDLIGSGEAQERGIIGETPNLAARLQGVAEPNMVVIAESTRRLLGNLFELQDLGTREFKGIGGPVPVWAALRPSSAESRFDALHGGRRLCTRIGVQRSYSFEEDAAVADSTNAYLFQVLQRQVRNDTLINVVLAESRLIPFEAKAPRSMAAPLVCLSQHNPPAETACLGAPECPVWVTFDRIQLGQSACGCPLLPMSRQRADAAQQPACRGGHTTMTKPDLGDSNAGLIAPLSGDRSWAHDMFCQLWAGREGCRQIWRPGWGRA